MSYFLNVIDKITKIGAVTGIIFLPFLFSTPYETQAETAEAVEAKVTIEEETTPESVLIDLGEFRITAYCPCEECCEQWAKNRPKDENGNPIVYTASGEIARQGVTIAADTNIFPFGTVLIIDGHEYVVQDKGGAIKGKRIDIFFNNHEDAINFGVHNSNILMKG